MEILQGLNEKQREAASHTAGALLVVAGPGTGKTNVITHRIAHLIRNHRVAPAQIFAVTFTNKAAHEMLTRIKELLGTTQGLEVGIHTFHAFCVGLLREHAEKIGLGTDFAIFSQETQDEVLIECLRELRLNRISYPPWMLRDIIGTYKLKLEDPTSNRDEIRLGDGTVINDPEEVENILDLLKAYQTKLASHNALDFDDLISRSVEALDQVPDVRAQYHRDIRFILVDEYQDINAAQYALLKLIARSPEPNVMVVADEDQSIYSWRGSDPRYIDRFKKDFNPAVIELEEHYRCSERILRAAGAVIAKNTRQKESVLTTHKGVGNTLYHYAIDTPDREANIVIRLIRGLVKEYHYSYGEIAVFYRTHQLADRLVDRLHQERIPFQRIGRANSFQEEHAQGIISYLNFIQWQLPRDIEKAINFPQQLIDDLTLVRLKWLTQQKGITLIELLRKIDDYPDDAGPLTRWNVRQFFQQIDDFQSGTEGEPIHAIVNRLFDLLSHRRSPYQPEDMNEIQNQPEFPGLRAATDSLYGAIDRGDSIHLIASYGIDSYCAAHIVKSTLKRYLDLSIGIDLLPPDSPPNPVMNEKGITILIGGFGDVPAGENTTILLGSAETGDGNVIQLGKSGVTQFCSVAALKLCQRLLSDFEKPNLADMIVYDLETIDNNPKTAEIIEIYANRLSAVGSKVQSYHQYVKPTGRIPQSSTRIHNINNETVANEPGIETVLPKFLSFIQDRILIGHNITNFDNPVLERDLGRYLKCGLPNPYYDTLATAQRLYPRESCSLEALATKFGVEHGTMHRADEDVEVNHQVFDALIREDLRRCELKSLPELLPLVGIGILAAQGKGQKGRADEEIAEELKPFYQAAARYLQTHKPDLDWLTASLDLVEQESVQDFVSTLTQTQTEESSEDRDWQARRAKFMNGVLHFETISAERHLTNFLDYQKLINSADEMEAEADKITLMTLHAAKGTEFPAVIILGLEDGTFPIRRPDQPLAELEEERRLFYVGMTRAQARLYLTSVARRRSDYERGGSMFLREIPSNLIEHWHRGMNRKR